MIRYLTIFFLFFQLCTFAVVRSNNKTPNIFIQKNNWKKESGKYSFVEKYKTIKPTEPKFKQTKPSGWNFNMPVGTFFTYFIWMIIIGALIALFIMVALRLYRDNREKIKNKKFISIDDIENIEEVDLDNALLYFENNKMFKEALRYKYLILLKELHLAKYIIWKKEKTNGVYLSEMYNRECFELFKSLTLFFEKAWYGDKNFSENDYILLSPGFIQIKELLPLNSEIAKPQ